MSSEENQLRARGSFPLAPIVPLVRPLSDVDGPHRHVSAHEQDGQQIANNFKDQQASISNPRIISSGELILLFVLTVTAVGVRLFRLPNPNSVVFDEAHFGKFASKYIQRSYFVDVHPPLVKLLIALIGVLVGYDGTFDFNGVGRPYENVPYVAMRLLPATLGVLLVPITYLILRGVDCTDAAALLGAVFVLFENGLVTQSRLILLDSPLLFFTGSNILFWVWFSNEDRVRAFSYQWWAWLALTGLSLGAVVSCKWVGLFTIATIGASTVHQLWNLLQDKNVSLQLWITHFLARAVFLILIPVLFYMLMFLIHFRILSNAGDGDAFMSAEFQSTLRGRELEDFFVDVGIGSNVTIRHAINGGYLHSHSFTYPEGSEEQQITLYSHPAENNTWRVLDATLDSYVDWSIASFRPVKHGMMIQLAHTVTAKRLHSQNLRPPVSKSDCQNEVSCSDSPAVAGDASYDWLVEIEGITKRGRFINESIQAIENKFRLRHVVTGCYLSSNQVKLPEWGFEQQEVTCDRDGTKVTSLWSVGTNSHPILPTDANKVRYRRPGFFAKLLELHRVMWIKNASLTKNHPFGSRPITWPLLLRGINFWAKHRREIYLLGNPFVWWSGSSSIAGFIVLRGLLFVRFIRSRKGLDSARLMRYNQQCGIFFLGWALHYFPFFLMNRELFLHHYFPALYFAIFSSCGLFDLATSRLTNHNRLRVAAVLIAFTVWAYLQFGPLAYGISWTRSECRRVRLLETWDFSCEVFPVKYEDYFMLSPNQRPDNTQSPVA